MLEHTIILPKNLSKSNKNLANHAGIFVALPDTKYAFLLSFLYIVDDDEVLDLVDPGDKVIGTILRSQTNDPANKGFLRAAEAFVQNKDGLLWIPRRQMHKRIAPGGLDYSMGEHVMSGESYLEACIRGFLEELNLTIEESELEFIHKFTPIDNLDYFRSLYLYRTDKVPEYNREDFTGYEWLTPKEVLKRLQNGEPAKASLKETVDWLIKNKAVLRQAR